MDPLLLGLGLVLLVTLAAAGVAFLMRIAAQQARTHEALGAFVAEARTLGQAHAQTQGAVEELRRAVLLLAEPGHLQDGMAALENALQPAEMLHARLDEQYAVSEGVLQTTGAILEQAAQQRAHVEQAADRIAALLEQWTADELARRKQADVELLRQYRDAGAQGERMTEGLLELRTHVAGLAGALAGIERAAEALETLARRQPPAPPEADSLAELRGEIAGQVASLHERHAEAVASYHAASDALMAAAARLPDRRTHTLQTILLGLVAGLLMALLMLLWTA